MGKRAGVGTLARQLAAAAVAFSLAVAADARPADLVSASDVGVSVILAPDLSASVKGPRLDTLRRAGRFGRRADARRFGGARDLRSNRGATVPLTAARDDIRTALDTASYTAANVVLDTARRANSVLYAVSASDGATPSLREVTGASGGRVIEIDGDDDPGPAFLEILQEFRRRYVVTFTPTDLSSGGWHRLDVRVRRGNVRVRARPGCFLAAP